VAAAKAKAEVESEQSRMRLFERFVLAYAADPEGTLKNPEFEGVVKVGKIERIPDGGNTKSARGTDGKDLPSKE